MQFEANRQINLKEADIWFSTCKEDSQIQHAEEVARIEKETQNKLGQLERRLRIELEGCKAELEEERKTNATHEELVRDIDTSTRTLRTQAERRRKRLYGEGLEEEAEDSGRSSSGGAARWQNREGGRKRRKAGAQTETKHPAFRPHKDLDMELEDWEVEEDIKILNNITSTSSRGRRPPAKLANGIRSRNGR